MGRSDADTLRLNSTYNQPKRKCDVESGIMAFIRETLGMGGWRLLNDHEFF